MAAEEGGGMSRSSLEGAAHSQCEWVWTKLLESMLRVSPSTPKSMSLVPVAHHPQEQAGVSLVNLLSHAFVDCLH